MTDPSTAVWGPSDAGFERADVSRVIGTGDEAWRRAVHGVLRWRVKTRSGFHVDTPGPVRAGDRPTITAIVIGFTVREPVEVVEVVDEADRVGFSYRTLPGHPVDGEEAFIVHRDGPDVVLTVRSLSRAAPGGPWHPWYPLLRMAQRVARRRYLKAL